VQLGQLLSCLSLLLLLLGLQFLLLLEQF
jgi:hypothetical protein